MDMELTARIRGQHMAMEPVPLSNLASTNVVDG